MPIPQGYSISNTDVEKLLEKGRNLRKSKDFPIKCRLILNRVWRMSKVEYERIQRKTDFLSSPYRELLPNPYQEHWHPYFAIIPIGGITRRGYVKEVWVEAFSKPIEVDNQHYDLIDPYVHDTEQWIMGFELNNVIQLLPSHKIVVKYYRHSRETNF